jgi:hypothetical protein
MYSLLENAIYKIDAGPFQKMVEYYLLRNFKGELAMPGGMEDKDKTRTGRPDIYMLLETKRYLLCEVTTRDDQSGQYEEKLKTDLQDCLDFEKLRLENGEVERIVLATNGSPSITLRKELEAMVKPHGITLQVLMFKRLVEFFYHEGRVWARDNLSVPFPTGQILEKTDFLRLYGKNQIAAPLDNPLHGRETELEHILGAIEKHEIVVLSGKPGVGKSRLALSAIDAYMLKYPAYKSLFVVTTGESISEDLTSFIEPGKRYIVLIDDANRQLESLRPALAKAMNDNIHVKYLLTVRDYAKQDLRPYLRDRDTETLTLNKLEEDIIHRILYQAPFGMTDNLVRNRIVQVAKGNARLAIMAADAYMNAQDINVLDDTSKIYEEYFKSVIEDRDILNDRQTVLVLGMLSFFQSLDSEKEETDLILADFGIAVADYNRIVHALNELELIEHRFGNVAKIADQVMGTYFFYLCFIQKKYYSPDKLLQTYFNGYDWRVKDTFIPAILAFGKQKVIGSPPRMLMNFLKSAKGNKELEDKFLDMFALYLPDYLFAHIYETLEQTPESTDEYQFDNHYKNSQPSIYDQPLRQLELFYEGSNKHFITALDLAIAYVDKHRGLLEVLLHELRSHLNLGDEEVRAKCQKIIGLYEHLLLKVPTSFPHKVLFYYGMQKVLLTDSFPIVVYEKRQGKFEFRPAFAELRSRFLAVLEQNFEVDRDLIFDLLMDYIEPMERRYLRYLELDQPQIISLTQKCLTPARLDDTYFVQEYINVLLDRGIPLLPELKIIQKRFVNRDYAIIRDLAADRNAERKQFRDYDDFSTVAERRINYVKKHVKLRSEKELKRVLTTIKRFKEFKYWHKKHIEQGFAWALESAFDHDISLGFKLLILYLQQNNPVRFNPVRLFNTIFNADVMHAARLYDIIFSHEYQEKETWLDSFYEFYPIGAVTTDIIEKMIAHFEAREKGYELHLAWFEKYENIQVGTIGRIAELLYNKRQNDKEFVYKLEYNFFSEYPFLSENKLEFAKKLYLDQEDVNPSFDPYANGLFFIMKHDSNFFTNYIDLRIEKYKKHFTAPRNMLNKVWEFEEAPTLTYDALVKFSEVSLSSIGMEDFGGALFMQLKPEAQLVAMPVLEKLLTAFPKDRKMVDLVMSIGRQYLPKDLYSQLIQIWLSVNSALEDFERIDWTNHHFDYANGLPGNQKKRNYEWVINAIEAMPENYKYSRHKLSLQARIERDERSVAEEVKLMYRGLW